MLNWLCKCFETRGGGGKIFCCYIRSLFVKISLNKNCNDPRKKQSIWKSFCVWVGQVLQLTLALANNDLKVNDGVSLLYDLIFQ